MQQITLYPVVQNNNSIIFSLDGLRIFYDSRNTNAFITRDAFCKLTRFKNQQEWRLFFYKENWNNEPFILKCDSFYQCCSLFFVKDLGFLNKFYKQYPLSNAVTTRVIGNISRKNLNDKIINKDNWGHLYFSIGKNEDKNKIEQQKFDLTQILKIRQEPSEINRAVLRGFM